jgi:hypothetical protein
LVKLGYTAVCRTGTRRRAALVRPRALRAVPPPWRPGRVPAEAARLPKASRAPRLPLKSAPPRGAFAFADRALARDHQSVRRSLHCASAPTKEVTVLRVNSGFASMRGQEGSRLSHSDLRTNPNARIHVRQDQVTHMHRRSEYQKHSVKRKESIKQLLLDQMSQLNNRSSS